MKIKDVVMGNFAHFEYYRHQHVYYRVDTEEGSFIFPIPLDDVQDATIDAIEKAITLMRYIRKAMEDGTFIKQQ